jgi:hypothetical protein
LPTRIARLPALRHLLGRLHRSGPFRADLLRTLVPRFGVLPTISIDMGRRGMLFEKQKRRPRWDYAPRKEKQPRTRTPPAAAPDQRLCLFGLGQELTTLCDCAPRTAAYRRVQVNGAIS